ncbi:MAG: hypothetical protein ACYCRD_07985 [Leptospirillum sp.]
MKRISKKNVSMVIGNTGMATVLLGLLLSGNAFAASVGSSSGTNVAIPDVGSTSSASTSTSSGSSTTTASGGASSSTSTGSAKTSGSAGASASASGTPSVTAVKKDLSADKKDIVSDQKLSEKMKVDILKNRLALQRAIGKVDSLRDQLRADRADLRSDMKNDKDDHSADIAKDKKAIADITADLKKEQAVVASLKSEVKKDVAQRAALKKDIAQNEKEYKTDLASMKKITGASGSKSVADEFPATKRPFTRLWQRSPKIATCFALTAISFGKRWRAPRTDLSPAAHL